MPIRGRRGGLRRRNRRRCRRDAFRRAGPARRGSCCALTGYTGPGYFFDYPEHAAPTTLAATGTDVTSALSTAASDVTTAGNDFGSSDVLDGALSAFAGIGYLAEAPAIELIGLVDTTLGSL
ncbi:hypothetical protein [Mycobacterium sp.]|uniref:hypothetical protein n=1 Tax=Mycobacterium sp. TaxID=1785 RepID=UPI003BB07EF5